MMNMENYSALNTHPIPFARHGIHERVIEYLSNKPRGKVLDIPTGYWALAKKLFDLKFDVSCCDIDPSLFASNELNVDHGDLNKKLPYKNEVFDYVCFLDGMHPSPIGYTALKFALEHAGFKIIKISYDKKKRKQMFLKPLSWAICLYTKLWTEQRA